MSYTVKVSNIHTNTSQQSLLDFFTFCGKITSIEYDQPSKTAMIHFEKASAAKTALMLNGGALDGSHLEVTSDTVHVDTAEHHDETTNAPNHIDQADKPRAGIMAEYLARGYELSDNILQRAIDIDAKQGISTSFVSYIKSLDSTLGQRMVGPEQTISSKVQETFSGAQAKAREVDEQKGISKTAQGYYASAIQHPLGKKVLDFYTSTAKQVNDIHEEARRIADHSKTVSTEASGKASTTTPLQEKTS